MHKPTPEFRKWNRIHVRLLYKRRLKPKKQQQRGRSQNHGSGISTRPQRDVICCPENLSLDENFKEVVQLINVIRGRSQRQRNEPIHIDFKPIRKIGPAGALVLAAELDRWNRVRRSKLRTIDVDKWDKDVRRLLREMGFFNLLQTSSGAPEDSIETNEQYVKFRSGNKVDGKAINDLREFDLDPHVGVPGRHQLFAAVTEAMTNVMHHAYDKKAVYHTPKDWWLSAMYNTNTKEIVILIYDQGAGIPTTLPRKFGERLREIFPDKFFDDHGKMIQAAHELQRSATQEGHRGHGLERDVRSYIERLDCRGIYRVRSCKGEYTLEIKDGGKKSEFFQSFGKSLNGTLIEWRLLLQ